MPGIVIRDGAFSSSMLLASTRCGAGGPPQVYLDGIPLLGNIVNGREGAFNLNSIDVSELGGVEYYPTTESMPIEFSHTSNGCGALMLWTRER